MTNRSSAIGIHLRLPAELCETRPGELTSLSSDANAYSSSRRIGVAPSRDVGTEMRLLFRCQGSGLQDVRLNKNGSIVRSCWVTLGPKMELAALLLHYPVRYLILRNPSSLWCMDELIFLEVFWARTRCGPPHGASLTCAWREDRDLLSSDMFWTLAAPTFFKILEAHQGHSVFRYQWQDDHTFSSSVVISDPSILYAHSTSLSSIVSASPFVAPFVAVASSPSTSTRPVCKDFPPPSFSILIYSSHSGKSSSS